MCIDTLEIGVVNRRERNYSDAGRTDRPDLHDVYAFLELAGYACSEVATWSNNTGYSFTVNSPDDDTGEAFKVVGYANRNNDRVFINNITAHPMRFRRWADFWAALEAMDDGYSPDGQHRIIGRSVIKRIDYTLDIECPTETIMKGLYIDRTQTMMVFTELDAPYIGREWRHGYFSSFLFGKAPKVIKIYDKRLERALTRTRSNDLEEAWADRPRPSITLSDRLNAEPPWTRIEIACTRQSDIASFWNRFTAGRHTPDHFRGTLAELPQHLEDIRFGFHHPFKAILLNHVQDRSPEFAKTVDAHKARHEIDMGFLIHLYQRMQREGNFWREHREYFTIHPWHKPFQPTNLYRTRMNNWFSTGLSSRARALPELRHNADSILDRRWPIEQTH